MLILEEVNWNSHQILVEYSYCQLTRLLVLKMSVKWENNILSVKLALICYLSLVATAESGGR